MHTFRVLMGRVLWLLLLAFGVGPVAMANQKSVTAGPGERLIREAPRPKVEWSAADRALRAAMDADPTYTSGTAKRLTQPAAIAAWTRFLERDDLRKEQQIFAWWRLGSLYAYNFDQSRGEAADYGKAERAFAKARELLGDLVTRESLNSATVWASIPGTKREKARRLASAFNWLFTRTNDDINRSAERINQSGYVVDKKFFSNIAHRESTLDERKRFLRKQLAEHRELAVRMVTEAIQYSRAQDAEIIAELLKSIEGAADPKQTTTWREMHRRLSR